MVNILVLTGPCGVGKTACADAVSDLLSERDLRNAVIDMDALRWAYPGPKEDPFNVAFGLKNLKTIWPNYAALGIEYLILPNVVECRSELEALLQAVPDSTVTLVRLETTLERLLQRLNRREVGASLEWHKKRSLELQEHFAQNQIEDYLVRNDDRSLREVAEEVVRKWLEN